MNDENRYQAYLKGRDYFEPDIYTPANVASAWEHMEPGGVMVLGKWQNRLIATYTNEHVFLVDYEWV